MANWRRWTRPPRPSRSANPFTRSLPKRRSSRRASQPPLADGVVGRTRQRLCQAGCGWEDDRDEVDALGPSRRLRRLRRRSSPLLRAARHRPRRAGMRASPGGGSAPPPTRLALGAFASGWVWRVLLDQQLAARRPRAPCRTRRSSGNGQQGSWPAPSPARRSWAGVISGTTRFGGVSAVCTCAATSSSTLGASNGTWPVSA